MNKTHLIAILAIQFMTISTSIFPQTNSAIYSGTYIMKTDEAELTLELNQPDQSRIKGTLSSGTGAFFFLEGAVETGVASGTCSGNDGSVFFELYADGYEIVMSLMEPDPWNMPDYNTATYLSFTKKGGAISMQNKNETTMGTITDQSSTNKAQSSGKVVGNPGWGFQFIPPEGWSYQQSGEGIIMGHTAIPGIILIFPHLLKNMQEVAQEMHKGIQEGPNYLMLNSDLEKRSDLVMAGDYEGMMDGEQARAKGFGTLSPYGGGAFVLAVSTPKMLGEAIIRDAQWIASNLIYSKTETTDLALHFTGRWASFTTNTSTWMQFYPDGTYDEQYESSYSGELSGGGNWGAAGSENAKGRWTVQGTRDQGRITVLLANGNEIQYDYRVHEERGEKYYSEYWFNGKLYSKSRD